MPNGHVLLKFCYTGVQWLLICKSLPYTLGHVDQHMSLEQDQCDVS